MENQVEEIKKKLDIVNVIGKFITLKKRGRTYMACCPFHNEKTPSFTVSSELQIFKCFGCGKSGDLYTFIQEFEKVDFREALEISAKLAGVTLVRDVGSNEVASRKKRLYLLNQEIGKFFHYILLTHPLGKNCLDYLKNRGISTATIKEFVIGFAPDRDELILNYLKKKDFTQDEINSSGCFSKSQYGRTYNRFKNRLVFPLFNHRGDICGFSGRVLPGADNNQAKYINSPETEIYHKSDMIYGLNSGRDFIRESRVAIVTEGEFDMISPFQAGIKNILAIKGTAFTENQLHLLHRFCDSIILALDSDFAGNTAALRSIELADSMDFDIKVLDLSPNFKDPDEAVTKDLEFFKDRLQKVLPVWDFVINSAVRQFGADTPQGKKQVLARCLPFISKINNAVIRSDYLKKLSDVLNSSLVAVSQESEKYSTKETTPVTKPKLTPDQKNFEEKLEEILFILILHSKKPHKLAEKVTKHYEFTTPRFKTIFDILLTTTKYSPETFQTKLPPELVTVYQSLYLDSLKQEFDSFRLSSEIKKHINQLKINKIKQEIRDLSQQIGLLDDDTPDNHSNLLEIRYNKLLVTLSNLQCQHH